MGSGRGARVWLDDARSGRQTSLQGSVGHGERTRKEAAERWRSHGVCEVRVRKREKQRETIGVEVLHSKG